MRMMIDAFAPEGVTELAVDSIFMMPHLGVLSTVNEAAATEVFEKDCIIYLGTCVAPLGRWEAGKPVLKVQLSNIDGEAQTFELGMGVMKTIELGPEQSTECTLTPLQKTVDVGQGPGETWKGELRGGVVGLVFDTRGRPIIIPKDAQARNVALQSWVRALDEYPTDGEEV